MGCLIFDIYFCKPNPSPTYTKMEFLNRAQKQVFADETDLQNPIESIPSFQIPQVADVCSPLP